MLTMLLVDDDPYDRGLAELALVREFTDTRVKHISDADGLASALEEGCFDLVVTDYCLRWTDGLAVLRAVRDRYVDCPVVMLTATGSEEIAVEAMKAGLDDYVIKSPKHSHRLGAAVRSAMARHQSRRALSESEDRYRRIVDTAQEGVWLLDPEGITSYVNRGMASMLGYADSEMLGRPMLDFVDVVSHKDAQHKLEQCRSGTGDTFDLGLVRKDGSEVWVIVSASLAPGGRGGGHGMLCMLTDITDRKRAEEELLIQRQQLRSMAARLSEIEEAERSRLARELHDQVGQNLTVLGINLNIIRANVSGGDVDTALSRVDDCLLLLGETTDGIRSVIADLRPPILDDHGLLAALRWYGARFSARLSIPVEVSGQERAPRLAPTAETALFRITQEALTNVAKHSNATFVSVELEDVGAAVRLTVTDDGIGFDPPSPSESGRNRGWGLLNIAERARTSGGRCAIESQPGHGTRVVVEFPR